MNVLIKAYISVFSTSVQVEYGDHFIHYIIQYSCIYSLKDLFGNYINLTLFTYF